MENEESERLLAQRTIEAMQPKVATMYIADQDLNDMPSGFIQPGTVAAGQKWGTFIVRLTNVIHQVPHTNTHDRKRVALYPARSHNFKRLLVCLKTSFWTNFSLALHGMLIGP